MNWNHTGIRGCWSVTFTWGFLLLTSFLGNGICSSGSDKQVQSSLSETTNKHSHSSSDEWPSLDKTRLPWDASQPQMPNIVPLTLHEQSIRQTKSTSFRSKHDSTKAPNDTKSNKKSSKKQNSASSSKSSSKKSKDSPSKREGKVFFEGGGQYEEEQEDASSPPDDLPSLQEKTLSFGKLVLDFLRNEVLPKLPNDLLGSVTSSNAKQGRSMSFLPDELGSRGFFSKADRRQEEGGGGVINRNQAIGWLARLIGVDGKTLGEFLREYQVHVLYDLVFTFFKWIFFLYAGLLIP